jgi:hypothetical protein
MDLAALDRAPDLVGIKVRQEHDGVPGEEAGQRRDLGVAVDERCRAEFYHAGRLPATVVDERGQVGVGEHVTQLVLDVPVVDVDRGGAELAGGDQRLGCLDGIARVEPHVVAGSHPDPGQVVG